MGEEESKSSDLGRHPEPGGGWATRFKHLQIWKFGLQPSAGFQWLL